MKNKIFNSILVVLLLAVIGFAASLIRDKQAGDATERAFFKAAAARPEPVKIETPQETLRRFRSEADNLARDYVSNHVVGFRRIRMMRADTYSSDVVTNWTGSASAEYINRIGGVDVHKIDFAFYTGKSGKILYIGTDLIKEMDEFRGSFWRALGMTNRPPGGWPEIRSAATEK